MSKFTKELKGKKLQEYLKKRFSDYINEENSKIKTNKL